MTYVRPLPNPHSDRSVDEDMAPGAHPRHPSTAMPSAVSPVGTAQATAPDPRAAAISGSISGAVAVLCTHPLDVARTKLAVERSTRGQATPRYVGTLGTLRVVLREEGRRGLYRGLSPALISHTPAAAIFFSVYTTTRALVPPPPRVAAAVIPAKEFSSAIAAASAWIVTCLALNPLFVLKTKQQTQLVRSGRNSPLKYAGIVSSARVVLREQGVRGLYAGTLAAVAGFPGAMVQMPLYEFLKGTGGPDGSPPTHQRVAAASATSSSIIGLATYPVEVVRLRLQAQGPGRLDESYSGILDGFRKIYNNEGFRAFYRGCGTSMIRSVPQSAIALCSFETILRITTGLMEAMQ